MIISLGTFFIVLNFSFFRLFGGKGEKYSPKWKIITSITRHISGKYILWSWIFEHLKDYIFRLIFSFLFFFFFFFFYNCIFQAVREVKGQKMVSYDKKFLSFALHISGTIYHMIVIYGKLVWNDDCSRFFFHFFKILILWVVRSKMSRSSVCRGPYLKNHISHGFRLWYSCVGDNILSDSASQKLYVIWLWLLVHMWKKMISAMFFIFSKFWFCSWRIKLGIFQYTNVIPTNLMKNMFTAK